MTYFCLVKKHSHFRTLSQNPRDRKEHTMFHPHFLNFFGNSHSMTETMQLMAALKVEQDLQDRRREEREREIQAEVERKREQGKGSKV